MSDSHAEVYLHFVWATRNREPILTRAVGGLVRRCIASLCEQRGYLLLAIGGVADHVHVLLRAPSTSSPSSLAHLLKGSSSHLVRHSPGGDASFGWQAGYAVFSVSPHDVNMIIRYIKDQAQHHKDRTDAYGDWELPKPPSQPS